MRNRKTPSQEGDGITSMLADRLLKKRPKAISVAMKKYIGTPITKIEVCRVPVSGVFQYLLNITTLGQWNRLKTKHYDEVFHLYMVIHFNNGDIISMEKNERVMVVSKNIGKGKCINVPIRGLLTLKPIIENAEKKYGGERLYRYNASSTNCQLFVLDLLKASLLNNAENEEFVYQNAGILLNAFSKGLAQGVTDRAGLVSYLLYG
jgi:hypothetical protein